jgi:hypothetical protein
LTCAGGNGARFLSLSPDFGIGYRLQKSYTDTKLHIKTIWSLVSVFMEFGIGIAGNETHNSLYYIELRARAGGRELENYDK